MLRVHTDKCGCWVSVVDSPDGKGGSAVTVQVVRCPMHDLAPALFKECERLIGDKGNLLDIIAAIRPLVIAAMPHHPHVGPGDACKRCGKAADDGIHIREQTP